MGDAKSTGSTAAAGETKPQFVDLKAFEELQKTLESIKKSQAGSDAKVADLLKENEELKKGKMTAEQKAEYERQQAEERIKEKDRELQEREIRLIKLDILSELELPKDVIDRIHGTTRDELYKDAKAFRDILNSAVKDEVTKKLSGSSGKPGGGKKTETKIDEIMAMKQEERARWIQKNRDEWNRLKSETLQKG